MDSGLFGMEPRKSDAGSEVPHVMLSAAEPRSPPFGRHTGGGAGALPQVSRPSAWILVHGSVLKDRYMSIHGNKTRGDA